MNNIVLTYNHRAGFEGDSDRRAQWLLWEHTWKANGWRPSTLSGPWAAQHPLFESVRRHVMALPSVNGPAFEVACYLRWLAYSVWLGEHPEVESVLVVDHDVVNCGYTPDDWALDRGYAPELLFLLLGVDKTPCCARLVLGADVRLATWFRTVASTDFESIGGKPHCSDQVIIGRRWDQYAHGFDDGRPRICGDPRDPCNLRLQHASTDAAREAGIPKFDLMLNLYHTHS